MDHGYPQITAINILQSYIKNGQVKEDPKEIKPTASQITSQITGSVDWREPGKYRYRKNEVFIDVFESVNLLMSNKGVILRSDVSGKILMKTYATLPRRSVPAISSQSIRLPKRAPRCFAR